MITMVYTICYNIYVLRKEKHYVYSKTEIGFMRIRRTLLI